MTIKVVASIKELRTGQFHNGSGPAHTLNAGQRSYGGMDTFIAIFDQL